MSHDAKQKKDYLANAQKSQHSLTPKFASYSLYLLLGVLIVALFWAGLAKVEIITKAPGKIIPTERLQVVQNLEGGIIKSILVKEGDEVEAGQVIAKLDSTQFASEYKKETSKFHAISAEMARLQAEANNLQSIDFPKVLHESYPDLVDSQQQVFQKNKKVLDSEITMLQKGHDLLEQELNIIEPLAKVGVMSKLDVLRIKRELNTLKGEILKRRNQFQRAAREQFNQLRARQHVLTEDITRTKDKMQRTEIRSPAQGVVNKIYVSTIGEVVNSGQKIMEIVPSHHALTIIAKIPPADIAQIKLGQEAVVKVTAYRYGKHGGLDAKVTNIGADTLVDREGTSFYEVQLKADKNYLGPEDKPLKVTPGMTVNVNFISGHRTILAYLMRPFLRAKEGALRER